MLSFFSCCYCAFCFVQFISCTFENVKIPNSPHSCNLVAVKNRIAEVTKFQWDLLNTAISFPFSYFAIQFLFFSFCIVRQILFSVCMRMAILFVKKFDIFSMNWFLWLKWESFHFKDEYSPPMAHITFDITKWMCDKSYWNGTDNSLGSNK